MQKINVMKIIAVEVTTYAVAKRKPQLHKLRFQLRRSSLHLFLHPAVQIYEIQEISYFSAKMVYIKCLIFLFVKHFLFFLFLFFFTVCKPKIDLTFVVDACSENVRFTKANFLRVKNFLVRLVGEFRLSIRSVRISLVLYAQAPKIVVRFSSKTSYVIRLIRAMKLVCGARYTGAALQYSYTNIIRRSSRKRVLVLLTTGGSKDDVRRAAALLQRSRTETFCVGIGRRYSLSELQYIASDRRHVYTAAFRNLGSLVRLIKRKICKSGLLELFHYPVSDQPFLTCRRGFFNF